MTKKVQASWVTEEPYAKAIPLAEKMVSQIKTDLSLPKEVIYRPENLRILYRTKWGV